MSKTAEEILQDAAAWLEENEWTQGVLFQWDNETGTVPVGACAMGAIQMGARKNVFDPKALQSPEENKAITLMIYQIRGGPIDDILHPIARWNDQSWRTKEDVILALKGAARHEVALYND